MPECTPHPIGSYMVLGVYGLIAQLILMAHKSCMLNSWAKVFIAKATYIIQDMVSLVVWSNQGGVQSDAKLKSISGVKHVISRQNFLNATK